MSLFQQDSYSHPSSGSSEAPPWRLQAELVVSGSALPETSPVASALGISVSVGLGYLLPSLGPCLDIPWSWPHPELALPICKGKAWGICGGMTKGHLPVPCQAPLLPEIVEEAWATLSSRTSRRGEGSEEGDWLLIKKQVMCRSCFIPIKTIKDINYQIWR